MTRFEIGHNSAIVAIFNFGKLLLRQVRFFCRFALRFSLHCPLFAQLEGEFE